MITIYLDDDTTPLDGYALTNVEAGALSDTVAIHIRNEGGTDALNVLLVMRTRDPDAPSSVVATGVPPQDEQWGRFRVTGYDDNGDTTWVPSNSAWHTLGAFAGYLADRIPAGAALYGEFAVRPSGAAVDAAAWSVFPIPIYNEYSQALPPALTKADRGLLHGIGDASRSGIIFKSWDAFLPVTASDDTLYVGAGHWLHQGRRYGLVGETYTINQNDSAAAALATGQSYWVVISLGAGVRTLTKGLKGTTPTRPSAPAGDVVVGYAQIHYDAGGTVIEDADLEWLYLTDRYSLGDGGALNLSINRGQAIGGGTWRYNSTSQTIDLTAFDDSTCYVWQLATGLFEVTADDEYPEETALPAGVVVCTAGAITSIVERWSYAGETVVLEMGGNLPVSVGDIATKTVAHERLVIDDIVYELSDNGGTSLFTRLDMEINGTTIYTDFATEETRPTFAHDAAPADLTTYGHIHQVFDLKFGDVLTFASLAYPGGGTPVSAKAYLICRKP